MTPATEIPVAAAIGAAIRHDDLDEVALLLSAHPDQLHFKTPMGGQTWLGYAVRLGSVSMVRKLIELGFDVNEGDEREGVKPLCDAAYKGRLDVATVLLDAGAKMDTATSVQNPLFAAIVGNSAPVARLLLDRGIDASVRYNTPSMMGMDALEFAKIQGATDCVALISRHKRNLGQSG